MNIKPLTRGRKLLKDFLSKSGGIAKRMKR
jgi:hypothetical protein